MGNPLWTPEQVREKLASNDWWVARALLVLFDRQTHDEQYAEETRNLNGVGFNSMDAGILSSFAKQVKQWDATSVVSRKYPFPLSPKQLNIARPKLRKYAKQLAEIANRKEKAT